MPSPDKPKDSASNNKENNTTLANEPINHIKDETRSAPGSIQGSDKVQSSQGSFKKMTIQLQPMPNDSEKEPSTSPAKKKKMKSLNHKKKWPLNYKQDKNMKIEPMIAIQEEPHPDKPLFQRSLKSDTLSKLQDEDLEGRMPAPVNFDEEMNINELEISTDAYNTVHTNLKALETQAKLLEREGYYNAANAAYHLHGRISKALDVFMRTPVELGLQFKEDCKLYFDEAKLSELNKPRPRGTALGTYLPFLWSTTSINIVTNLEIAINKLASEAEPHPIKKHL